ncbi:phospholipase A2 [Calycomorphotria hydatis]|uniref:Prokaryotic phospholipase A2 n=1 Tax=Calycomorphotria hydatis TaxID=2528027 RepID=A0A517TBL0_9PLAN|nr:phospholipase A2 [Calycomorphotria hydatis]QDT65761.1 Prokaryotic phospholipase A2 [Calycomorphotria hydatis]
MSLSPWKIVFGLIVAFVFVLLQAEPAKAGLFDRGHRGGCGQNGRPCGPGGVLNYLIPQGFAGADFRPACRRHDACYRIHGVSRAACDRQFYRDLHCACRNSKFPWLCRLHAKTYYNSVKLFGARPFREAQGMIGW